MEELEIELCALEQFFMFAKQEITFFASPLILGRNFQILEKSSYTNIGKKNNFAKNSFSLMRRIKGLLKVIYCNNCLM